MKQTNPEVLKEAHELLDKLAVQRGGSVLQFHRQMANDPGILKAFSQMYEICNADMKHIPKKYRELIVFAVGVATKTQVTIDVHAKLAIENGATVEELGEVLRMLFFLTGVTGFTPGLNVFEPIDEK